MKLLVSWMHELSGYISREFYYIMHDLIEVYGWRHIEPPILASCATSIREYLSNRFGEIPDVVLFWETYDLVNLMMPALRDLGCRTALFADDMHMLWGEESKRGSRLSAFSQCDLLMASYAYVFDEFYPELRGRKKVVWVPHSASPDFVLPFNDRPENAILLSGFVGSLYPLRMRMQELRQRSEYAIIERPHPGYRQRFDYNHDSRIGSGYATTINRFKAAFTDSLVFRYVVAKYFEIPATGALLVADDAVSEPLKKLGFTEYIHYLPVSAENLEEKIHYALDENNSTHIKAVRQQGQQLVLSSHRTRDRAKLIDSECNSRDPVKVCN